MASRARSRRNPSSPRRMDPLMIHEDVVAGRPVAFVRVSSLHSELDSQKEVVDRFAGRVGNYIRRWYEDPDRPRWKAERPEVLRQLLADAEERQFDRVVLDKAVAARHVQPLRVLRVPPAGFAPKVQ